MARQACRTRFVTVSRFLTLVAGVASVCAGLAAWLRGEALGGALPTVLGGALIEHACSAHFGDGRLIQLLSDWLRRPPNTAA